MEKGGRMWKIQDMLAQFDTPIFYQLSVIS